MVDTITMRRQVFADLDATVPKDSLRRQLAMTKTMFAIFYDNEAEEPEVAIGDALTDLMHVAADRGVDFEQTLSRALRRWGTEREEWGVDR